MDELETTDRGVQSQARSADRITFREKEPKPSSVETIVLTEAMTDAYTRAYERYQQGYHDLMVLTGPQGQEGSVRLITHCIVVDNPDRGSVFQNVQGEAIKASNKLPENGNQNRIYGIGTIVGNIDDVKQALMFYDLYIAGGPELKDGRPQQIIGAEGAKLYTKKDNEVVEISPENVKFLKEE